MSEYWWALKTFRVTMTSTSSAEMTWTRLLSIEGVRRDDRPRQLSGDYFVHVNATLLAEAEVTHSESGSWISLRFAVCHPKSSDFEFETFVVAVAVAVNAETVSIGEETPPGVPDEFTLATLSTFCDALAVSISRKRELWVADFGVTDAVVFPNEAIQKFILPHCIGGTVSPGFASDPRRHRSP